MYEKRIVKSIKGKKYLLNLDQVEQLNIPKIENKNLYSQNSRKNSNLKYQIITPPIQNDKLINNKKIRIKSPQSKQKSTNYSNNTLNQFRIATTNHNNEKNSQENIKNKKDIVFPKIRASLNNQYNISDNNISNTKTLENPHLYNNLQSIKHNKKSNPVSIKVTSSNITNIIDENFRKDHKNLINNRQTKSTRISKLKILQKEKSQEGIKQRLLINSVNPLKRNHNSNYYPDNYNYDNIKENIKNDYNNHRYFDSKKNSKRKISFIKNIHPIAQNKKSSLILIKDKQSSEKEKNKKRYLNNNENKRDEDSDEDVNKKLLDLRDLFNTLSSLNGKNNSLDNFGEKKEPVELSPEIFSCDHSHFKPSIYSSENEFEKDDLIKAYAYNTSEGNIREYNEDTITAAKINLNTKEKNNYFYFFGIYDGHGGKGCSLYLKSKLHKNITEVSVKGIKNAVKLTEISFLENEAVNIYGEVVDRSGSCACFLLIKDKKCIIANIGDSRCVVFKNKKVIFATMDHKPNVESEKKRIESAGGSIYQTNSVIPLYQNGKLIEIPWRVLPGRLSVCRTFGDIESKDEKFGGNKNVIVALPDIFEFELNEEYNFAVIGCDGIFDVLSNMELMECIKIVLKINKNKKKKINELCGDFAAMIIKSALAKESFDNISCIVIIFNINGLI